MSFYYVKPESDQSPTGSSLLPPFDCNRDEFSHALLDSPSYFGQPAILRSSSFSDQIWADRFNDDSTSEMFLARPSLGSSSEITDVTSESSDEIAGSGFDSHTSKPYLSDEDYNRLEAERPWEGVPVEEVNHVPAEFSNFLSTSDDTSLRLGPFKALLRSYILQAVDKTGLSPTKREDLRASISTRLTNSDLIQYAKALGLYPLVIRLHLEFSGLILPAPQRADLLVFRREKRRRAQRGNTGHHPFHPIMNSDKIEYFPGIELKLGKERDTLIRPMVTSVFRSDREAFRSALLVEGLKYGELRMWKDSQLCTALHVADSFRPGIWAKAVELHVKKMSRPPRVRKSIQKG